ncbi:hypothetical protein [Phenylobacterium hankyongense]|nr:hypothetical protein [Phenylobacterium hankyongense]
MRSEPEHSEPPRIVSPGLETALEHFASSELLAAGKVNIIALDAVVERFGGRWTMRREQVHAHVHAYLDRHLTDQGYYLRTSDTDTLICLPDMVRHAAQATCLRYLRDILGHFLGESQLGDLRIHEVLAISGDGVVAQRVDPMDPRVIAGAAAQSAPRIIAPEAPPPSGRAVHQWTPFVSASGRAVQVSCELEPVYELRGLSRIGVRLLRTSTYLDEGRDLTPEEYAALPQRDILRIDLATISAGLAGLKAEAGRSKDPSIILPVSVASLSNLDGRAQIVSAFKEARELVDKGVICQLCEVELVPPSIVLATTALIRPFSLLVVGQVKDCTPHRIQQLKGAGLQGLAFDCATPPTDAEFVVWARPRIAAAHSVAKSLLLYGLASTAQARLAAALGVSHAAIRRPRRLEAAPREAARLEAAP